MSKKEKSIQSVYEFLKTVISYFFAGILFVGIFCLILIDAPVRVGTINKQYVPAFFSITYICLMFSNILVFFVTQSNKNLIKQSVFFTVIHIFSFYVILPNKNCAEIMFFLMFISWVLRMLIESIVINRRYNIACIGYKDILIQKEEVKVYPLYSEFIWRIFLSHLEQCPEENKKIMLQDVKTFADRIYKLHTEDLELLGIVDDEHSYVKQVEIYFDRKNQKLVKYYQYDYENYESKKGLEKFILRFHRKK